MLFERMGQNFCLLKSVKSIRNLAVGSHSFFNGKRGVYGFSFNLIVKNHGSYYYSRTVASYSRRSNVLIPQSKPSSPTFPTSLENLLFEDSLIISRQYEMLNIFFGYEQHNRYLISNSSGVPLAYILEENGFWRAILRQVLRTRRPLKAVVVDTEGQLLLDIRRPWTFINSKLSIIDSLGNAIGEVHQLWHLWRRKYELFVNKRQIASIDAGFLSWDFPLLSENEKVLGLITRNFTHIFREMFTDAGEYVIMFRDPNDNFNRYSALSLTQKAVVLGCAISVDFDYFSRHSQSGLNLPIPFFFPGSSQNQQEELSSGMDKSINSSGDGLSTQMTTHSNHQTVENSSNQNNGSPWTFVLPWLSAWGLSKSNSPLETKDSPSFDASTSSDFAEKQSSSFIPDETQNISNAKDNWFVDADEEDDDGW